MQKRQIIRALLLLSAIGAAFHVNAATFNDTWIDSTGRAVSGRDGATPQTRSTASGQTSGAIPAFSMESVTIMSEATARAISDLESAFGDRQELVANCAIPAQNMLSVVLKPGATENRYNRFGDRVYKALFEARKFNLDERVKIKFGISGVGNVNTDWTSIEKNYQSGSRYYDVKSIVIPKRNMTIKLHRSKGFQVLVDGVVVKDSISAVSDLDGAIIKKTDNDIATNALNMPIISYLLPRLGIMYLSGSSVVGSFIRNKSGEKVVIAEQYTGMCDDGYNGQYSCPLIRLNESLANQTLATHLVGRVARSTSEISPYWLGYDNGGDFYVGEMYKSNGKVNIKDGFAIASAEQIKVDGKNTRTIKLKISPAIATNSSGQTVSAMTSPFIVSGGLSGIAEIGAGSQSETTYYKDGSNQTITNPFASVAYPGASALVDINCTLN